ncbi:MAG: 4Fe-4S binding protein [Firmicutes bacterium]|nr:4Fe-4S binding protein [Bacillota bacterium]MCL5039856.1 4Fe-4S binding protein [Bacillota bacterium]
MDELEILEKIINPYKANLDQVRCLNMRHKAMTCQACVQACPSRALTPGNPVKIIPERCAGCGLCVPSCPTGALSLSQLSYARVLGRLKPEGKVALACAETSGGPDAITVPCLAFLSPEVLAAGVLKNQALIVDFDEARCRTCELKAGERVKSSLARTRDLLEASGGGELVISPGAAAQERTLSRREFFGFFKKRAAQKVTEILPEEELPPHHLRDKFLPEGKALFFHRVREARGKGLTGGKGERTVPGLHLDYVWIGEACNLCGDCSLFCPTGALERRETKTTFQLLFDPQRCLGCGLCHLVCRKQAVTLMKEEVAWEELLSGGGILLLEKEHRLCQICERKFVPEKDEELCPDCQRKTARENLWLELARLPEKKAELKGPPQEITQ